MIALGWVTNIFQRGAASMGRLNYILTAQPSINDAGARPARTDGPKPNGTAIRGEIEFRGLTFAYPTTRNGNAKDRPEAAAAPVVRDIDLRVPAGSTLEIGRASCREGVEEGGG